jgi:sec-independent protein translocase protein TatA
VADRPYSCYYSSAFGGKKIPDLMRGLGEGIKEFKKATNDKDDEKDDEKPLEEKGK